MDDTGATPNPLPGKLPAGLSKGLPKNLPKDLIVCQDPAAVAQAAAARFVEASRRAIARDGLFCAALSGGGTPRRLYQTLAASEFRSQADWTRTHLFWSDERSVPPDHPDSNFGMAQRELLSRVPVPSENVHRMEAERVPLESAAEEYEQTLRRYLRFDSRGFPRLHLILLGIGQDGHTASLFPGSQALRETSRWVVAAEGPAPGSRRMTLTLPTLNAAHQVLFLVAGADKGEILRAVLSGTASPPLPAQQVAVPEGTHAFLADEAAAVLVRDGRPLRKA